MCGKTSTYHITWEEVYGYATALTAPAALPENPESRINVSPSRLRRKSEADSLVWETLPIIYRGNQAHEPAEAIWPYIPAWSQGRLPTNKQGRLISTANARLRTEGAPFAPTFMPSWKSGFRVVVVVSWFYEFDSRVKPQIPYAVFPLDLPFWMMAGLARRTRLADGSDHFTVTIITVDPNDVLKSVGHHRSPALLRNDGEALQWLEGDPGSALDLLRPYTNETMGVEPIDMGIKIPGNQNVEMPEILLEKT
jgi:putative SOS response-associated peptidase YedK